MKQQRSGDLDDQRASRCSTRRPACGIELDQGWHYGKPEAVELAVNRMRHTKKIPNDREGR